MATDRPSRQPDQSGSPEWSESAILSAANRLGGPLPEGLFGVVVQDSDGAIVACTPPAEEVLGLTFDQMRGRSSMDPRWAAITADGHPLAGDRHPAMVALRTGRPQTGFVMGVERGTDPGGVHVWLTVDSHPDGSIVVTTFAVLDVGRTAELRLAQSERMFRAITERSHEMVGIHGLDGAWLWASPAAERVLGHLPQNLLGTNMFDVIVPEDLGRARAALATVVNGDGPATLTLRARHRSGQTIWVDVIGQLIEDASGRPYQVQTSTRDVTARVTAEHARDAAIEVFRTAMQSSPIGMAVHSLDGTVRTTNRALRTMLQCNDSDLVGSCLADRAHVSDRPAAVAHFEAVLSGAEGVAPRETRFELPDRVLWVESTMVALRAYDGTPTGFLEQLYDVTARKDAETELLRRATRDPLTGLPNRAHFVHLLEAAIDEAGARGTKLAVVFIDIDDFKLVNDRYGHAVGDEVLRDLGRRLVHALDGSGHATRYGGDEFAVLCEAPDTRALNRRIEAIRHALERPFVLDHLTLRVTSSVGISVGSAMQTAVALLEDADRSMYLNKKVRLGRHSVEPTDTVS